MKTDNIAFIHINKCGGTSIKYIEPEKKLIYMASNNDYLLNLKNYKYWRDIEKVTFVRNPYYRIISLCCMSIRDQYKFTFDEIINIITDDSIKYRTEDGGMVKNTKEYIKRHGLPMTHEHYSVYDKVDKSLNVDHVFKIEEIENNMEQIKNVFGITQNIPHKNKSKRYFDLNAFSKEQISRINDYFHLDFSVFNYEKL